MKKILALCAALALSVVMVVPAFAGTGNGNIGAASFSGPTYDAVGHLVNYTCGSVHEKAVAGGVQDKESCVLAAGATLPTQALKVNPAPLPWYSDYQLAVNNTWVLATSWSYKIMPSGTVNIVSFYATPLLWRTRHIPGPGGSCALTGPHRSSGLRAVVAPF
jgi:hypothetical protein